MSKIGDDSHWLMANHQIGIISKQKLIKCIIPDVLLFFYCQLIVITISNLG